MTNVLIVDNEFEKYKSHLEPIFPEVDFSYVADGDTAAPLVAETEVIISIGRWLTADMANAAKNLKSSSPDHPSRSTRSPRIPTHRWDAAGRCENRNPRD